MINLGEGVVSSNVLASSSSGKNVLQSLQSLEYDCSSVSSVSSKKFPLGSNARIIENSIDGNEFLKREYKPVDYIVTDLIGTGLILFSGIGKVGKTTAMCWLIKCINEKQPFLGFNIPNSKTIYYFNLEMTMDLLQQYFHIQQHSSLDNVVIYDKENEKTFVSFEDKINFVRDKAEKFDLIIIDTLESFSPGMDHNDSKIVKRVLQAFKNICEQTGSTIIVIDHNNKDNFDETKDDFAAIRGSVSKISAVDQVMVLRKFKDGDMYLASQGRGMGNKRLQIHQIPELYGYEYNSGETPLDQIVGVVDMTEDKLIEAIKTLDSNATTGNIAKSLRQEEYKVSRDLNKLKIKGLIYKDPISRKSPWQLVTITISNDKVEKFLKDFQGEAPIDAVYNELKKECVKNQVNCISYQEFYDLVDKKYRLYGEYVHFNEEI